MVNDEVIVKFNNVSFEWQTNKPILNEASFAVRRGSKITLMGQNGAGKSTIFQLITGQSHPESGSISINNNLTIAIARQVVDRKDLELTITDFFTNTLKSQGGQGKIYDIDKGKAEFLVKDISENINIDIVETVNSIDDLNIESSELFCIT